MTSSKDSKSRINAYIRYSGMALQFFVLLAIAAWAGQWLDERFSTPKPFITVFLILLFAGAYFYKMYRDLTGEK